MSTTDDELERRLSREVGRADSVPSVVLAAGRAALGWRRLDAELAELLGDSALDPEPLALTRGGEAPLRSVTFGSERRTIEVDIIEHGAGRRLRGQLSPGTPATVEVQRADGTILASTRADELGRFLAELEGGGTVRLRVTGDRDPEPIETSWVGL